MIINEKGSIEENNHRSSITKVRGGWTQEKIKKELKNMSSDGVLTAFYKEIAKYDTPEEFSENLFYHGSGKSISRLKPSIVLKNTDDFGGGYDQKYYGISLSRDRDIASNFTGTSNYGNVAPVLIKRGSVIKKLPDIKDSVELEDIIVDLWNDGVDAVVLGDHNSEMSEQEVVILNPKCISVGKSLHFNVFGKKEIPSLSKSEMEEIWTNSSETYKSLSLKEWNNHNESFKEKYGRSKDEATMWSRKQENLFNFHQCNVLKHKEKQEIKRDEELENKPEQKNKKRRLKRT